MHEMIIDIKSINNRCFAKRPRQYHRDGLNSENRGSVIEKSNRITGVLSKRWISHNENTQIWFVDTKIRSFCFVEILRDDVWRCRCNVHSD